MMINDFPVMNFVLTVQANKGSAYRAEVKTIVSLFKVMKVRIDGVVPVRIDRRDPRKMAIELDLS